MIIIGKAIGEDDVLSAFQFADLDHDEVFYQPSNREAAVTVVRTTQMRGCLVVSDFATMFDFLELGVSDDPPQDVYVINRDAETTKELVTAVAMVWDIRALTIL